jgi:hypothetical protein
MMTFQTRIIPPIYRDFGQSNEGLSPAVEEALASAWMRQIPFEMRPRKQRKSGDRSARPEWCDVIVSFLRKGPATRATMMHNLQIGESTLDYCLTMLRHADRIEVNRGPYRFKLYSVKDVS